MDEGSSLCSSFLGAEPLHNSDCNCYRHNMSPYDCNGMISASIFYLLSIWSYHSSFCKWSAPSGWMKAPVLALLSALQTESMVMHHGLPGHHGSDLPEGQSVDRFLHDLHMDCLELKLPS